MTATIIENREIAQGVYRLVLGTLGDGTILSHLILSHGSDHSNRGEVSEGVAATSAGSVHPDRGEVSEGVAAASAETVPGQFFNLYLNNDAMLLPRPFGISDIEVGDGPRSRVSADPSDRVGPRLVFVYAVVGAGTAELASYAPGTTVRVLGPNGNGYTLEGLGKNVLLVGGGLGIPPLLFAARRLREGAGRDGDVKITALLGYRDEPYYSKAMGMYCDEVFDISEFRGLNAGGARGVVTDLIARLESDGCGLSGASAPGNGLSGASAL
ncbi:MAG: hypothetical protein LBS67_03965, partial [Clostridiales Family XIII bacterium]|nr:hypothetical protein [Clostridiales Family XIII bacterium]